MKSLPRRIIKSIALALLASPLFAQQQNAPTLKTSVYFASGKAVLEAEAQAELERMIQLIGQYPDFELDVRAYTDDVGKDKSNRELANLRAQSVHQFLADRKVKAFESRIQGLGELQVNDAGNIEELRRQNRRVDIEVTPFQPRSLNEFYGFFHRRNQQQFTIRPQRDTTLIGSKGTVLFIPAGSFVSADGKAVNQTLTIELNEAYSYADMLAHNLATVSDGKILETGGMVYIDAKLPDGAQVRIKPGSELTLSMPTSMTQDDGMQLFVAERNADNPAAAINWTTDGTSFAPNAFQLSEPEFNFMASKLLVMNKIEAFPLPDFPKELPAAPQKPSKPFLFATERPTLESVAATCAKGKTESEADYKARLQERLASAERAYNQRMEQNAKAVAAYEKAMNEYQIAQTAYQNKVDAHLAAKEELFDYLKSHGKELEDWLNQFQNLSNGLIQRVVALVKQTELLGKYRNYLVQECQRYGFADMANQMQALQLLENNEFIKEMARKFLRCGNASQNLYNKHVGLTPSQLRSKINSMNPRFFFQTDSDSKNGYTVKDVTVEEVYNIVKRCEGQIALFNELIDNYNEVVEKAGFFEHAAKLQADCDKLAPCYDKVTEERLSRTGKAEETRNAYLRSVGIKQLGWINCDRFYNNKERTIDLLVNSAPDENTTFFAVFEDIRSVMGLVSDRGNNNYIVRNLPASQRVKIVGIRVEGGSAQVSVQEGTVASLNGITPVFQKKSLSQVRDVLNI